MEHSSFSLKVKAVAPDGSFTGIGAVFNNVDLGGDKILPGAFTRTLAPGKQLPLLWQHDPSQPIGTVKAMETQQGLMVEGQLLLSDPTAKKAYEFLKAGIIKGLSIGYETVKADFVDAVRELQELKLWELSIVTFPMNEAAMVTGIKALSDADRSRHLKAIDEHRKAIDRHQRGMRMNLKALFGDDLFNDESDSDLAGDPALLEGENQGAYGEMSMVLEELKSLAAAAEELASA